MNVCGFRVAVFSVGNGKLCCFWEDCWVQGAPLKMIHQDLYKLARNPSCRVVDCWEDGSWGVNFRRCLTIQQHDSWLGLLSLLKDCSLTDNRFDSVHWALEKKKHFTTKSLYRFLTNRGFGNRVAGFVWRSKVPLKIKVFLWQILNNKLQVAINLVKRGWKGSSRCCLCYCDENIDHIFFKCRLAVS